MPFPKVGLVVIAPALLLVLIGCTSSRSLQNEFDQIDLSNLESLATGRYIQIFIETEADAAEKIKIAEQVVEEIEPGIKERVSFKFPNAKPWQIDTISITPKSERMYWLQSSSWTHSVYIEISLGFSGDDAWPILQYCGEEVQSALQNVAPSSP